MKNVLFTLLLLTSCREEKKDIICILPPEPEVVIDSALLLSEFIEETAKRMDSINLVNIQSVNPRIQVDLKYASSDNFMGIQLYDTLKVVYLNIEVAERLSNCQDYLDSIHPGYNLLVYDGVRPWQVQKEMWDALDSIPVYRRGKFVSNPARGSVHNYGAAVDLTIIDSVGNILDMGAGYDDSRKIAYPSLEYKFFASGELTKVQVENRKLLRKVMKSQKFRNIPSEWWHFNAFSRVTSSRKYQRLLNESGEVDWYKLSYPKKDSNAYLSKFVSNATHSSSFK
ncbi:MAG TPA: peptidase M15 [Crocinitomicaceae bacterium]|nr:peptidase M15 [Crocinitomicaceae bacterium]